DVCSSSTLPVAPVALADVRLAVAAVPALAEACLAVAAVRAVPLRLVLLVVPRPVVPRPPLVVRSATVAPFVRSGVTTVPYPPNRDSNVPARTATRSAWRAGPRGRGRRRPGRARTAGASERPAAGPPWPRRAARPGPSPGPGAAGAGRLRLGRGSPAWGGGGGPGAPGPR